MDIAPKRCKRRRLALRTMRAWRRCRRSASSTSWPHALSRTRPVWPLACGGCSKIPRRLPSSTARTGATRDLRPSDIAILAATNRDALTIASALGELAIDVALPRRWLLETAEGTFLHAALRVVADERDTIAWSQLDALDGFGGVEPDDWLAEILERRAQDEPLVAKGPTAAVLAARERLLHLAPSEAVDELIGLLDLPGRAISWPRPEERLANLEALRALASSYEDDVEASRAPGSIVGFLHFLEAAVGSGIDETGQDRGDPQHAGGSDAVQLCTYHRSKGLEWPVVILSSLNAKSRSFGIAPDAAAMRLQRGGPFAALLGYAGVGRREVRRAGTSRRPLVAILALAVRRAEDRRSARCGGGDAGVEAAVGSGDARVASSALRRLHASA